jgi:hypothetical protein
MKELPNTDFVTEQLAASDKNKKKTSACFGRSLKKRLPNSK